jgi:hypothetical protein
MSDIVIPEEADAFELVRTALRDESARLVPYLSDADIDILATGVLEAALPALRRQWAEEVATIAEEAADDLELPVMPEWLDQRAWFKDQLHALAARVREYGETK